MSDSTPVRRRGLFTAEAFQAAIDELVALTKATKIERAPRSLDGGNNYAEVPDNATRLGAVKLIITLETGSAPQSLDINMPGSGSKIPTSNDAVALLTANPELAQRLLGDVLLNSMKKAQKAGKLGDIIEIAPSKAESESVTRQR